MENQIPTSNSSSDEIDLGQLFRIIGRGIQNLFKAFLRLFVYFKRNMIKLGILLLVGLAIGIGLNQIMTKRLKTEVIVRPNLESKNYLYDVVNEIQANIGARDTAFFEKRGIDIDKLKGFEIMIEPVGEPREQGSLEEDLRYLELLEKFENDDLIRDVVRSEIMNKSALDHRITFFYKNAEVGHDYAKKLMEYINSNEYYDQLLSLNKENAKERIKQNENLVTQIDQLISNYSEKMTNDDTTVEGRIVLDTEDKLDVTGLLGLRSNVIRDTERKKLEILEQKEAIRVLNFGNSQVVQKAFLSQKMVLIPLLFIGLFFLLDLFRYLNRKAREMQV